MMLPSNVAAAGLSLALQLLCLELALARHASAARIVLHAMQVVAGWCWLTFADRCHALDQEDRRRFGAKFTLRGLPWSFRMTIVAINAGQAAFAIWVFSQPMRSS